jgi:phosphoribosylformylglycinamidine synthase
MAQFVECLRGMGDACRALDFPIISGNVSLYNESKATGGGSAILPTPAIGGVGLLDDWMQMSAIGLRNEGDTLLLIGHTKGHVGQSLWLEICHGRRHGPPPPVDLEVEKRLGQLLRTIAPGLVNAIHDCSDGGAVVAMAEMALAGGTGFTMTIVPELTNPAAMLFGEDQGRAVVATGDPEGVRALANEAGLFCIEVGVTGGDRLIFDLVGRGGEQSVSLADLRAAHEGFFPALMQGEL